MHTVNGRKCEVKKALPRDDQSLLSSGRGNSQCCSTNNVHCTEYWLNVLFFFPGIHH